MGGALMARELVSSLALPAHLSDPPLDTCKGLSRHSELVSKCLESVTEQT